MDRNHIRHTAAARPSVALRKESVDRNLSSLPVVGSRIVALRKESVDRNGQFLPQSFLSNVALRKESVDRNLSSLPVVGSRITSLSARRAWIEILILPGKFV